MWTRTTRFPAESKLSNSTEWFALKPQIPRPSLPRIFHALAAHLLISESDDPHIPVNLVPTPDPLHYRLSATSKNARALHVHSDFRNTQQGRQEGGVRVLSPDFPVHGVQFGVWGVEFWVWG